MPFGAWSPLPLRLGADPQRGWSSQAQSRLAADLVAAKRTLPLAQLTIDCSTGAVLSYTSQYGTGPGNAPAFTALVAPGHFGFVWDRAYESYDETFYAWRIRAATVTVQGSAPTLVSVNLYSDPAADVELGCTDILSASPSSPLVTLTVWGDWLPERQIGDYDGATDKADSLTEGDASYCYEWFTEMQAMRGSAYSVSSGNVDAENFAIARQLGALSRNAEKLEANSLPGTSDEKLETWVQILGVPVRQTDQRWQVRQRAEAKLKSATSNAQPSDIDAAVQDLLGDSFVAAHRNRGSSLSAGTPATYWPVINDGNPFYSLGGGAWYSDRYFYWVEVEQPAAAADSGFQRLMGVDFFDLLDLRLPAHMTFGWATSDGFILGQSLLGYAAFGP